MFFSTILLALCAAAIAAPVDPDGANLPGHWQGHCFGTPLDHAATEASGAALRSWANSGPIIATSDHNRYVPFQSGDVIAYACTDDHNGSNFFSSEDVDAAYAAMDKSCPMFTSSYAIYVYGYNFNPNTGKIIGKDVAGHPVCQGYNGH